MARSRKKSGWFTWTNLKYLIVLLSGSGAGLGGWQISDTLFGRVVERAKEDTLDGHEVIVGAIKEKVQTVLEQRNANFKEGRFEVRIEQLAIDSALFKSGRTIDLQVLVAKLDAQGKKLPIWNSQSVDRRTVIVGSSPIETSWHVSPFEVNWAPGDHMVIEVWDRKSLFSTKLLERTEVIEEAGKLIFPLKTGSYPLSLVSKTSREYDPAVNQVVLRSRRVGASDVPGGVLSDQPTATARRDSDTIFIR